MTQFLIHYSGHFILPAFIIIGLQKGLKIQTPKRYSIFFVLMGNLIDLDHLFATPIFQNNRCSIDFHWLHLKEFFYIYFVLFILCLFFLKIIQSSSNILFYSAAFFLGAWIHLFIDWQDCQWMSL